MVAACPVDDQWCLVESPDEMFRALVAFAPEPMTIVDSQGSVVFANDAVHRLTGLPVDEHIGRRFYEFVHVDEQGRVRDAFERALVTLELTAPVQLRMRSPGGRWASSELRIRCVEVRAGRYGLIYWRNVDSSGQLDARLRHAQRLNQLGRLTLSVADDYAQVVTTILAHFPGLFDLTAGRPASLNLRAILRATERAASLTGQLRAFSDTTAPPIEQVDVHALLNDVRRLTTGDAWLKLSLDAKRTKVQTDRVGLVLGLKDLILSLHHALPEDTAVVVRTSSAPDASGSSVADGTEYVIIEITNDAQDASPERAPSIDRSHLWPPSAGVMLAVVTLDDIVSQSRGGVDVGTADNRATTVRIFLPVA